MLFRGGGYLLLLKPIFIGYKVTTAHGVDEPRPVIPVLSSVDATLTLKHLPRR
jgi:hypothetical protein